MDRRPRRHWQIGELAKQAGVSVRALRHYDELGLLNPSERSEAGYRLYAESDVRRLYRIVALRQLGFPLEAIASLLDAGEPDLAETARRHLERVERDLESQKRFASASRRWSRRSSAARSHRSTSSSKQRR